MPPRRRPRSWLAGRLRSAAGAVQRLAGRVEPAGHLPPQPPSETPAATPRRFGEPPQHWLDLVAAHAPGLLHDLDLDPPAAEPTEGRDAPAGGPGFGDRLEPDGPDRWAAVTRPTRPVGEGAGFPADSGGRRAPGTVGRAPGTVGRAPGTVGRAPGTVGRAPGTVGRRAPGTGSGPGIGSGPGTGSGPGRATSMSGPEIAAHPDGRGRPASATPGTVGSDATAGALYGVDGSEVVAGGGGPDGSPATGGTGRSAHTASAADRSGSPGISGASQRASSDAATVAMTAAVPIASDGDRRPPVGLLDGWRLRPPFRRVAATGPARDDAPTADTNRLPLFGQPPRPPIHTALTEILEDLGPSRGAYLPRSTTDSADVGGVRPDQAAAGGVGVTGGGVAVTGGGVGATGGGRWLALPDDRARSGQRVGERFGPGTGNRNGPATRTAGVAWGGSAHRDPGGGWGPESGLFPPDTTALDPWPALPDDTALWAVAGAALDAAQLTRLDREQAGD